MQPRRLFRAYVAEAGDGGWRAGSDPVWILSAAIVRDADDRMVRTVLDQVNTELGRAPRTPLRWGRNLTTPAQRLCAVDGVADAPVAIVNVLLLKQPWMTSGPVLRDPALIHSHMLRRLIERISWYVDDRSGEVLLTLAQGRRQASARIRAQMALMRAERTAVRWSAIRRVRVAQPHETRLLQLAGVVAGSVHSAVSRPAAEGQDPSYLMLLARRIVVRDSSGRVDSYGLHAMPQGGLERFPWWEAFRVATEPQT